MSRSICLSALGGHVIRMAHLLLPYDSVTVTPEVETILLHNSRIVVSPLISSRGKEKWSVSSSNGLFSDFQVIRETARETPQRIDRG